MRTITSFSKKAGFTIVELAIVIAVLGILVTIVAVAFTSASDSARDTRRKADVDVVADALKVFYSKHKPNNLCGAVSSPTSGNSGLPGYGQYMSGFFSFDYDVGGPRKSIEQCLRDEKLTESSLLDPTETTNCTSGSRSCYAYMVATCLTDGQYETYVYANLETGDHSSTTLTDNTCQFASTYDTQFGMNYVKRVQ